MELLTIRALVISEFDLVDNDKLLTLLSAERGAITVTVKGGKSLRNKNSSSAQLLCYSEFTLKERNGFYTLNEASLIEQFFHLLLDMGAFALAQYVAEVCQVISVENDSGADLLSLALNTLYMLCRADRPTELIKAAFELRCACISGLCPDISVCRICSRDGADAYLDDMNGSIDCGESFGTEEFEKDGRDSGTATVLLPLSERVLKAMRYVIFSQPKRIFSFSIPEDEVDDLARICEKYLLNQLGRGFTTLDFYKRIKAMG